MRLLAAISSHGYGHAMQTCLVINALQTLLTDLEVIIYSQVPRFFLESRLTLPFSQRFISSDIGMLMRSAVDIDLAASCAAYLDFHRGWQTQITELARNFAADRPDLILANAPYLSLAAAQKLGIPALALCSLNWAEIYRHYCLKSAESAAIYRQIIAAYQSAACFLQATPYLSMAELANARPIAPLASIGNNQRLQINQQLNLRPEQKLVLVGLGGIDFPLPVQDWPVDPLLHWLIPGAWQARRADMSSWETLNLPFIDTLRSCDALLTKPGYGSFTEAVCNGAAVVYVERGDWPETPYLQDWLMTHGLGLQVSRAQLFQGSFFPDLLALLEKPKPTPPQPGGAYEAATIIVDFFRHGKM